MAQPVVRVRMILISRARERYADLTPEEFQRRRARGWDLVSMISISVGQVNACCCLGAKRTAANEFLIKAGRCTVTHTDKQP